MSENNHKNPEGQEKEDENSRRDNNDDVDHDQLLQEIAQEIEEMEGPVPKENDRPNGKVRTRAFPVDMDESVAKTQWIILKSAIQEIMTNGNSGLIFEELYRIAYTMVLHKHAVFLYDGLKEVITDHYRINVKPQILQKVHLNFSQVICQAWSNHLKSMVWVRDILMYMDRVYIPSGTDNVHNLGINTFKREIIQNEEVQKSLQASLIVLIRKDRDGDGDDMDRKLIKDTCQMLLEIGICDKSMYESIFERPFLKDSEVYYKAESEKIFQVKTVPEYIKLVEGRMNEEIQRVNTCLDHSTEVKITEIVENELVKRHMRTIIHDMESEGVVYMLENHKLEDLKAVYTLFSRISHGLEIFGERVSRWIRDKLQSFIMVEENPITCVQRLLDLKGKLDDVIQKSFSQDRIFQKMITDDFQYCLNSNPKSLEYLALFLDDNIRKELGGMSDEDNEATLDNTMMLSGLILDKNMFERYYKKHLTERLISLLHKSVISKSDIIKNDLALILNIISKLKKDGSELTAKLEGMHKDLSASDVIMKDFKTYVAANPNILNGVELTVRVLTTVFWPICPINLNNIIPDPPLTAFENFKKFYAMRHNGRRLAINPKLGSADIIATFHKFSQHKSTSPFSSYIIQVSTYQMCILALFNTVDEMTFDEIFKKTEIPKYDLKDALRSLAIGKMSQRLLLKIPNSPKTKIIDSTDVFRVNDSFQSNTNRITIATFASFRGKTNSEWLETMSYVNECRKLKLEACILRFMKGQKTASHDTLMAEVLDQFKLSFLPTDEAVILVMDDLIKRSEIRPLIHEETKQKLYNYIGANLPICH